MTTQTASLPKLLAKAAQKFSVRKSTPEPPAKDEISHQTLVMNALRVTRGEIGNLQCYVVDARALYELLGVDKEYNAWLSASIQAHGYRSGVDYECSHTTASLSCQPKLLRVRVAYRNYTLNLAMANKLALVERNSVGSAVHRYLLMFDNAEITPARTSSQSATDTFSL